MSVAPTEARAALPGPLPEGERVLWAGRPGTRPLARHLLRGRWALAGTGAVVLWPVVGGLLAGRGTGALAGLLLFLPFAAPLVGLGWGLARLLAKSSLYVLTDRRLILHVGYAFTRTVNIPLALVTGAALREHADGTGDISVALAPPARASWRACFPHVRLTRLFRPEPTMRGLDDAAEVAGLLATALACRHGAMRPAGTPALDAAA